MNRVSITGLILTFISGAALDSEGKAYFVVLTMMVIGFILLLVGIIYEYKQDNRIMRNQLMRTIERERRRQA